MCVCVCVSMGVEPRLNDRSSPQPHCLFYSLVDKICTDVQGGCFSMRHVWPTNNTVTTQCWRTLRAYSEVCWLSYSCIAGCLCSSLNALPLQPAGEFYPLHFNITFNPLTPNYHYSSRTAPLTFNVAFYIFIPTSTEYFKHGIYSPFLSLQNADCFIILTYLVPVLFTFYIVLKLKNK